jgi:hypothetical protein
MKTIIESMQEKNDKLKKKLKDRKLFNKIYVWERDSVSDDVDIDKALQIIASKIPKHFFSDVEGIYIGQFPELIKRNLNALFQDGAIYVSSNVFDTEDLLKNIMHEIAHSIEEIYSDIIYDDLDVVDEFKAKRTQLRKTLDLNGYKTARQDFENLNYDENFDNYLYQEVGYPILHTLTTNLFVSPYAATSFKEYFANGFEHYYITDYVGVKSISPKLFLLISKLENLD